MPSVGTAYVNVRVNTKGFDASLKAMLDRASTKMEAAGAKLGKDFERGLKKTNYDTAFKPITDASGKASTKASADINKIGASATQMGSDVRKGADEAGSGLRGLNDDIEDTHRSMTELGKSSSGATRSLGRVGGAGGRAGGGLRSGGGGAGFFSDKLRDLKNEADSNVKLLRGLFYSAAGIGTAFAGAIGALSGAAQGIFAVGANAAAAAPALAVMANGLLSLAQVGGVASLAMSSVSDALTAGFKTVAPAATSAGSAATGMGKATAAAARQVRDAKEALADAYREAARSAADAARRVAEAENALAAAQVEARIAQEALTQARIEGREEMEDIAFAAEDAGLAERQAALDLAEAQQKLAEVSELAPDDRARVEAQLAFEEADLNMRQAIDRREDADKAQKEAAKKGVEGTEAVTSAQQDLADAQQAASDATQDLADARRDEARTAEDNAERISDALQAVRDAQQSLSDAQKSGAGAAGAAAAATDAYAAALAKLSPEQRAFVERIVGMHDEFVKFRSEVTAPLFKSLLTSIDTLEGSGIAGTIQKGLTGTATALGEVAEQGAKVAASPAFQKSLGDAMASNNKAIGNFGSAGVYLADAFVQVADAAGPLFEEFSRWVEKVTQGWSETARLKNRTGELTETFNTAADRVKEFWGLAKQLWRTIKILGEEANNASNKFEWFDNKGRAREGYIPSLTASLRHFNNNLDKAEGREGIFTRFDQALKNLNATGRAFKKALIDPLLEMGSDPNIEKAMNTIAESDAFSDLAATAGDAVPELAEIVVNIAEILANMSESGAIDHFLDIMKQITDAVSSFSDILEKTHVLKWTGYVTAATAAIGLLWGAIKIISSPWVKLTKGFSTYMSNVRKAKSSGKGLGSSMFGSIGKGPTSASGALAGSADDAKMITAIETAAGRIVVAIEVCCTKMVAAMGRGAAAGAAGSAGALGAAPRAAGGVGAVGAAGALGAAPIIPPTAAGSVGKFSKILGPLTKMMKPLSVGLRVLGGAFRFMLGPVGMIAMIVLPLLWPLLVKLNEKFHLLDKAMAAVSWTLDKLGDLFSWLWDEVLKPFFGWIADNAGKVWDKITDAANATADAFGWLWDKIKDIFGWIKKNWPLLLGIITGPIGLAVVLVIKYWDEILAFVKGVPDKIKAFLSKMWDIVLDSLKTLWGKVKGLWDAYVRIGDVIEQKLRAGLAKIWDSVLDTLKAAWEKVKSYWWKAVLIGDRIEARMKRGLRKIWNVVVDKLKDAWAKVKEIWGRIVEWLKGRPDQFMRNLRLIWDILRSALSKAWDAVKGIWTRVTTWVKGRPKQFATNMAKLWDVFKEKLKDAWEWVKTKWGDIKTAVGGWPAQLANKLSGLWDGIKTGLKTAWDAVADALNKYVIGGINSILDKFGVTEIKLTVPHITFAAEGGPIRGPGGPKADRVPAMLSNGEYVLPTRSARKLGHRALEYMRKYGQLPPDMSTGGILGSIFDGIKSVGSALAKGPAVAAKWVIDRALGHLGGHGWVSDAAIGAFKQSLDAIVKWVVDKEPVAVKGVAVSAQGWTYPLTARFIITQAPNAGHNPANAVDIGAPGGTGVRAAAKGIAYQHTAYGYGNYMTVSHEDGSSTLYAHLQSFKVASGTKVLAGQIIALSDSTGAHTSGNHLHFELNPSSNTITAMAARGVKLGQGGVVAPSAGGTLAVIAEAGQHERVTPLDSEGFTPAERRILESLESQFTGGAGDTYNVHPSRGMDEAALADMVARRVAWKRRRGGGFR